ncbi:hypothetical protein, partial [Enterobacter cloacae]|uniref:hypothetical protein n=1 Tax=Enterobacter cloacae TaxID=550 RepID=UPI001C1F248C
TYIQAYLLSGDTATVWCFRGLHHQQLLKQHPVTYKNIKKLKGVLKNTFQKPLSLKTTTTRPS